jgi:5'-3' exonuclease
MRVHVIDGTYELFRAFFGAPPATSPAGAEVGATRGLLRSFIALLKTPGVTHVACAFDHVIESFRNELFAGYKTGVGLDPRLTSQFELAERATRALGIVVWPMIEFECDDALATAARTFADDPRVETVVIASPDKDLCQCVIGERVVCWDRLRNKTCDEPGVVAKFGVPPRSIPDLLALVGDSADGIPGVPRWGMKSAAAVLARFGSIEAIPDRAADWGFQLRGAEQLAQTLREHRGVLELYKRLATLRTDVPLAETLADLEWRGADRTSLVELAAEIGDAEVCERVPRFSAD